MSVKSTPFESRRELSWLGMFVILGISFAIMRMAIAIATYSPAVQPTGYVAQVDLSNYNLTSGNETEYRTEYEREFWSGNLYAYPVSTTGTVNTAAERWTGGAANQLDQMNWDTDRLIATMNDSTKASVPFRATSLSAAQQTALALTLSTTTWTATQVVNYLRGDRTNEGLNLPQMRYRKSVLGDIVHSRPYYVDDSTNPTVFVSANDGMLHAFNADTGVERWAYVPSMLLSKLKTYANNPYTHDYFADGQINVGSVTISGTSTRIIAGDLGAGGKGVYALKIDGSAGLTATTETGVASKLLWEVMRDAAGGKRNHTADSDYNNLGYTDSTPLIAQVPTGQDAVIVGNGYNDAGDYQAYLYVINAADGTLIRAIQAGTSGTASSPNGLSAPKAIDVNFDGKADRVYAGDLNGTLWKFDLTSTTAASWTASALLVTSPAQPITSNPSTARHPDGGYMVTFGTGGMFSDTDMADSSVYYVYGVWDGAPVANTALQTQTLEERSYTQSGSAVRVRRASNNSMTGYKGWKVALPAGERVGGQGMFIENGTFFFTSYDPTKSYIPTGTTTTVYGENWLMELDYLSGGSGSENRPIFDMNGDLLLTDADRITYTATDVLPMGTNVDDPILTTDGIIVGKFQDHGVMSQPVLVQLATLNFTLFNQNPDVVFPQIPVDYGVTGGHFDVDVFYGNPPCGYTTSGGTGATATITVGSTGSSLPATLGGILVDGTEIVPALTISDLPNGTATTTNATTIKNKVTNGFTATVSSSTVTVTAPVGTSWNGKTFTFISGTSQAGLPGTTGVRPTGLITFSGTKTRNSGTPMIDDDLSSQSIKVGGVSADKDAITPGRSKTPAQVVSTVVSDIGTGGSIQAYIGGNSVTPTCAAQSSNTVCLVDTTTYGNGASVTVGSLSDFGDITISKTATAGGVTPVAATGWEDLAPQLSGGTFSGGTAPTITGYKQCFKKKHIHQWDDVFNVTGVNTLAPSDTGFDIKNAITSTSTAFKVLMHNQYLSPAVKLHIGDSTYLYNVDAGYVSVKDYMANVASLDLATLPTYTRTTVGSLAVNMPKDALTAKNWWGNGDVRAGLIPNKYACVWQSDGTGDSNLYQPVIPPTNGDDGPGVSGSSGNSYAGVRHNGALTLQVIKDSTPNEAIELNDPNGRLEYGWRLKKEYYDDYLLVEWSIYWHHPNNLCYDSVGWTKAPAQDNGTSSSSTPAAGSSDPKIGDLSGGGGDVTSTATTVSYDAGGNEIITTVITYANGSTATIVRTHNADGTTTIVTTDALGNTTTEVVAATGSCVGAGCAGGNQRGDRARTGRVSWHEIVRD
ncbi:MAG: hypothetical protein KJ572_03600 [Gammaproteobacteria bacterium]|nr:hypothetical protein [Sideroxydans sp.]MBU4045407.1 hypothetical protein [Gammaproteobacteria bacterium]